MLTDRETELRPQLREWRARVAAAVAEDGGHLAPLLKEIDSALERLSRGNYGVCAVCHDMMNEAVAPDPLARFCLSHLSAAEARALERDLDALPGIQCELLPKRNITFDGWEMAYHYQPLGPVSGDLIDLQIADGGGLFFLVGDVSGKGIAASMLMVHLHAIFRSLLSVGLTTGEMVERANQIFCASTLSAYFATLVCGRADKSGMIEFVNAGHCPPLVLRCGELTTIATTGLPVGMFRDAKYTPQRLKLCPGDRLLLYTDGLTEARDARDAEYGAERLTRLVGEQTSFCSQSLIDACLDDLKLFQAGAHSHDDLTIMTLRRLT
ncbi:MAG TPA: PP2C family protein-serine/threonine phosphatase [Pyrinomonadaceae bacterium]|nr:PP2C family protein-serine/threonine phosphatase [Pyrinomonadaceae bacterium]